MIQVRCIIKLFTFTAFTVYAAIAKAQDVHFAQSPEMNIWYNPALKLNKIPQAHAILHNVNYPGILKYTSKAIDIQLPLISKDKDVDDIIPFANLTAGVNTDNSNGGFMSLSTAMLSLSYALLLNGDDTYLSAGFQGNYSFSRVGQGTLIYYPDQFDKNGAFASALVIDPYQSGYSYSYFSAAVGASIFHSGQDKQWYIGGAIHHFNHPYTEWTHSARLAQAAGIQAGYTTAITGTDVIGAYANYTWQTGIHDGLLGVVYTRSLDDSANNKISCSLAFRASVALTPGLGLTFGKNQLDYFYEINIPGGAYGNYKRRAYTISFRRIL